MPSTIPAAPFSLEDQDGKRISLESLKGKAVVLTFVYLQCADICPLFLNTLADAEKLLPDQDRALTRFVAVTIDPRRDTPQAFKAYMRERGLLSGNWHLLTGAVEDIQKLLEHYEAVVMPAPDGALVHNGVFIVIGPDGRERAELHGSDIPADVLAREIQAALK